MLYLTVKHSYVQLNWTSLRLKVLLSYTCEAPIEEKEVSGHQEGGSSEPVEEAISTDERYNGGLEKCKGLVNIYKSCMFLYRTRLSVVCSALIFDRCLLCVSCLLAQEIPPIRPDAASETTPESELSSPELS